MDGIAGPGDCRKFSVANTDGWRGVDMDDRIVINNPYIQRRLNTLRESPFRPKDTGNEQTRDPINLRAVDGVCLRTEAGRLGLQF